MPVTCDWAQFCEEVNFDPKQSQSLSLSRIIEQAAVGAIPTTIGPLVIAAHLEGSGDSVRVGLRATGPDGSFAVSDETDISFEQAGPYLLITIGRLNVAVEGRYRFDIIFDDVHVVRSLWLTILQVSHDSADRPLGGA